MIEHNGQSLERLIIHYNFHFHQDQLIIGPDEAKRIAIHCSLLEDLTLTIPRSKGDKNEVAIYNALGSIPRLQDLQLTLNAAYIPPYEMEDIDGDEDYFPDTLMPNDPSFDGFDQQVYSYKENSVSTYNLRQARIGHLRDGLINGALDEKLARAIFDAISMSKSKNAIKLESLKVTIIGVCEFGIENGARPGGFGDIVTAISHSWCIHRNPRDDSRDKLMALDMGNEGWRFGKPQPLGPDEAAVFHRVWPSSGSGDWIDDWHSFPLVEIS
jgi:hypothetical protein